MSCNRCRDLRKSIDRTPVISGPAAFPPALELAYLVNLEYFVQKRFKCVHEVQEESQIKEALWPDKDEEDPKITIKEMVEFLEHHKWELGTRTTLRGFSCSSFLNRPAKQLVIVHRGTENLMQIKTDIELAVDSISQGDIDNASWQTLKALLNHGLKQKGKVGEGYVKNEFSVTITGHSLGGLLAQVCTLIFNVPKKHPLDPPGDDILDTAILHHTFAPGGQKVFVEGCDLHCVAFDSPGAKAVLTRLSSRGRPGILMGLDTLVAPRNLNHLDITVYLSNPNPVNLHGEHVGGKVVRIDVMKNVKTAKKLNPIASHSMDRILKYFMDQEGKKSKPRPTLTDPIQAKSKPRPTLADPIQTKSESRPSIPNPLPTLSNPFVPILNPQASTEAAAAALVDPFGITSGITKKLSEWKLF